MIQTVEEFQALAGVSVVVATAKWCGPCQTYKPLLAAMRKLTSGVSYYLLDVDAVDGEVLDSLNIAKMPTTFVIGRDSKGALKGLAKSDQVQGVDLAAVLKKMYTRYAEAYDVDAPLPLPHPGFHVVVGSQDLHQVLQGLFRGIRFDKGRHQSPQFVVAADGHPALPAETLVELLPILPKLYFRT